MKISTGGGDKGFSSLADGKPLLKSDAPFEVMGDLDELSEMKILSVIPKIF